MIPAIFATLLPAIAKQALPIALPAIVDIAEGMFPKRSPEDKRGAEKKEFVMSLVTALWSEFRDAGKLPRFLADNEVLVFNLLSKLVDVIVQAVKKGREPAAA